MKYKIENTAVYGIDKACIASGNAMRTIMEDNTLKATEKDLKRGFHLGGTKPGEGHDNFLNGIIVQMDVHAPLFWWKQAQRYHFFDFISSQSTMHRLTKFPIVESCIEGTDLLIMARYQELLNEYEEEPSKEKWRILVCSLPSGFILGSTMTTNYRQLKTMYHQRKYHKLGEWKIFCDWCESLPMFKELVGITKPCN